MRKLIEDFIAVGMLVGSEAWFLKGYFAGQPDFEPGLLFFASLGAILAKEPIRTRFFPPQKQGRSHDQTLFQSFLKVLPPNQTSSFFKEQDFGNSFPRAALAPLYEFVSTWNSVDKEFLDGKLEKQKKVLYSFAAEFANQIACRTSPLKGGAFVSVFSDQLRANGQARPEHVIEDAKVLNQQSAEFVPMYENFVRACKARLEK